jgi:CO/xanthine dehydrogenase FAD-binding subunit
LRLAQAIETEEWRSVDTYIRPGSIEDAVDHLSDGAWTIVAGCTDHYPARVDRHVDERILDISAIGHARGIITDGNQVTIGALTTWSGLKGAALPPAFDALKVAAGQIGGIQIQNAGTLGGNVCNASPAADGIPPLLIVDAELTLASAGGTRTLPLDRFILGNRHTARCPDELLTRITARTPPGRHASVFLKLGSRAYQVISIAMVAALLAVDDDGRIAEAAIAVGACSEVARRLPDLEAALSGRRIDDDGLVDTLEPAHLAPLSPIDDIRGTGDYRLDAAATLVRRAIVQLQRALA